MKRFYSSKFSYLLMVLLLSVVVFGTVSSPLPAAAASDITVILDGKSLVFDVPPMIQNGRTLVPMRAIFEAMGATIDWKSETKVVTATKGSTTIVLTIGSTSAKRNNDVLTMDVPAQIVDSRTLVPLRFIGESLGATVDWKDATRTITIQTAAAVKPPTEPTGTTPASFSATITGTSTIIKAAAEVSITTPMSGASYYTATGTNNIPSSVTEIKAKAGVWCTEGGTVTIKFYSDAAGTKLVGEGKVTRK